MTPEQAIALRESIADPVWYCRHVLGFEPWSKQRELLRAFTQHKRIAVRSGHKVSKSHSLSAIALWWITYHADSRVAITSASFNQVEKIIWREITKMHRGAGIPLGGQVYRDPGKGIIWDDGREIFGFSTDQPERAAGISSPKLLYLIDEASGVGDEIFEACEGNRAAGATMGLTSNPTKMSGQFYDAFHRNRRFWHLIHISSEDSPNVTGEMNIPGLAGPEWIEEKRAEWGEDNPQFHIRVLGNFPGQGADSVIGLSTVTVAQKRYKAFKGKPDGALRIGVDVARFGDDETVLQAVRGFYTYPAVIMHGNTDGKDVATGIMELTEKYRRENERVRVKIDEIGVGSSPVDVLGIMSRAKHLGIEAVPVNVSHNAEDDDTYANLRTEMCFTLNQWLKEGGMIPENSDLQQELVSPTYDFDAKGRRRLTTKKQERKMLGRSPDRRNALELAITEPKPRHTIGGGMIPT